MVSENIVFFVYLCCIHVENIRLHVKFEMNYMKGIKNVLVKAIQSFKSNVVST